MPRRGCKGGDDLTTDKALADERETIGLMRDGQGRGRAVMRSWMVQAHLHKGPLTQGQREAVKLILSAKDRVVGVQGYAGTGKTTMLNRARALLEKRGFEVKGLAPSASAVKTLGTEAGIESETLQRFLARNAGVAGGRLTKKVREADARGLWQDGARGGRRVPRLHPAGPRPPAGRQAPCASPGSCWWAMRNNWTPWTPASPSRNCSKPA